MSRWPLATAVLLLIGTWLMMNSLSHGEPVIIKKPFREFPVAVADRWEGKELGMAQDVLDVLKLSDYIMRVYTPVRKPSSDVKPTFSTAPVWVYVGYYQSQRTGATYHSPKNCLPGAGWQFAESSFVQIPVRAGSDDAITINKVLIEKGLDKQVILYWYQDRGRVIASEYWAKAYLMWDAMTKNRTDGSLVRLSIPVTTTPDDAYNQGVEFLQDMWPHLQEFLPKRELLS